MIDSRGGHCTLVLIVLGMLLAPLVLAGFLSNSVLAQPNPELKISIEESALSGEMDQNELIEKELVAEPCPDEAQATIDNRSSKLGKIAETRSRQRPSRDLSTRLEATDTSIDTKMDDEIEPDKDSLDAVDSNESTDGADRVVISSWHVEQQPDTEQLTGLLDTEANTTEVYELNSDQLLINSSQDTADNKPQVHQYELNKLFPAGEYKGELTYTGPTELHIEGERVAGDWNADTQAEFTEEFGLVIPEDIELDIAVVQYVDGEQAAGFELQISPAEVTL
ncbi:MAG: hypothetical protein AAF413_03360 [Patescibacteria group bacterium]